MTTNPPAVGAELSPPPPVPTQTPNGDTDKEWILDSEAVVGLGSFHKSLPHNEYGEVHGDAFSALKRALSINEFMGVPPGPGTAVAPLTNPLAGLADDRLISKPHCYTMPAAPAVMSDTTAAEMVELYWMALLRDVPFNEFETHPGVPDAVADVNAAFARVVDPAGTDSGKLRKWQPGR